MNQIKKLLILIILSIMITYLMLHLGRYLTVYKETFKIGTPDGWLGFFGSLFGVMSTYYIFFETKSYDEENRRIDKYESSIAYISLTSIEESSETLGAGDNLFFDHFLHFENPNETPIIDFSLNSELSYMEFRKSTNDKGLQIISLKELNQNKNISAYIPPKSKYSYTLRMHGSDNFYNKIGKNENKEISLENFSLKLVFNYRGKYTNANKVEYSITIDRYNISVTKYGNLLDFTTIQKSPDWTPLFVEDIKQKIRTISK